VNKAFRLKEAIKRVTYHLACGVGRVSLARRILPEVPNSLRVLTYHKINDQVGNSLSVPLTRFEQQMTSLRKHYTVIDADRLLAYLDNGQSLPRRAVLLTFDDGYLDVYENAFDTLKRYSFHPVMFVATDFMDGVTPFPHDRRFTACRNTPLSWAYVRELATVFEIGSQGRSHRPFTQIPLSEARDEIIYSKHLIEDKIGRPVRLFSYPRGRPPDFNEQVRDAVIRAGYSACFITIPRTNRPPMDRFALCRYNVEPYGEFYFGSVVAGSCDFIALAASTRIESWKRFVVRVMGADTDHP
jgi:peptidoglycan/xylan/chitin deacetylase (PgdA/CDA1 family)